VNLECRFVVVWPQRQTFVRILLHSRIGRLPGGPVGIGLQRQIRGREARLNPTPMCLYVLANSNRLAHHLARSLESCLRDLPALARDFGSFLLLLPGVVVGALVVGVAALFFYPVKLSVGSYARMHAMCVSYFGVIASGVEAYDQQGQPPSGGRPPRPPAPGPMAMIERLRLQVPLGLGPGDTILVDHPRGNFSVVIPQGVAPGGSFFVELPPQVCMGQGTTLRVKFLCPLPVYRFYVYSLLWTIDSLPVDVYDTVIVPQRQSPYATAWFRARRSGG